MIDRKAYNAAKQKEYRAKRVHIPDNVHAESTRQSVHIEPVHAADIKLPDPAIFSGIGRGIPVKGHVLISTRNDNRVVTEKVWRQSLNTKCQHDLAGWSCKQCA